MGWIRLFYMWRRAAAYLSSVFCLSVSCLLWTSASISVFSLCYQDRLTLLSSCVWNCRWFGARMPTNRVIIVIFFPDFGTREEEGAKRWCLTLRSENDLHLYVYRCLWRKKALSSDQDQVSADSLERKRWIGLFLNHTLKETQISGVRSDDQNRAEEDRCVRKLTITFKRKRFKPLEEGKWRERTRATRIKM